MGIAADDALGPAEIKQRLPRESHDITDVFDRSMADQLPSHRPYDHKIEFMDDGSKSKLPRSRIYLMLGHIPGSI